MNILTKIVEKKLEAVAAARKKTPEQLLQEKARARTDFRPFFERLSTPGRAGVNIIAEIKRASPSKGHIKPDLDPANYARAYAHGGARALSVLTDEPFFMGSSQDLIQARDAVSLPVLRKDFIVTEYQLYESCAMGADAVLFIVRILSHEQLKDLMALSRDLNLDALVEVHTEQDLEVATKADARLIGINNRNLKSFETDTQTSIRMASRLNAEQVPVAASGIKTHDDIRSALNSGIFNFLIGESLVRSENPSDFLKTLIGTKPGTPS